MGHSDDFMLMHHFEKAKASNNRCYWCEMLCRLRMQFCLFDSSKNMWHVPPNPKWSELQFDLVLEFLMLLGFMRVASLEEWHIFQLSVWTLMEIVCFYEIKPL